MRDTVTNKDGVQLVMGYDNANHSATFMLNGDVLELKQDTVASGIKYSNAEYENTEHQGKLMLKKGDKILFIVINESSDYDEVRVLSTG